MVFLAGCGEDSTLADDRHKKTVRFVIERMKAGDLDTGGAVVVEADRPKYSNVISSGNLNQATEKAAVKDKLTAIEELIDRQAESSITQQ